MTDQNDHSIIAEFLSKNPDIERIEAIFPTINGIYRGKWMPAGDFAKLTNGALRLPVSTYALDSWGIDVESSGLGIANGDPDGIGQAVPHTLSRVPWAIAPTVQIIMTMQLRDDEASPCPYDPRQQLAMMCQRFAAKGLTPVLATELEFYLIKTTDKNNPRPQPFQEITNGNLNHLDQMLDFEPVLNEIRLACDTQNVAADVMIAEAGMCQFEINFKHLDDPLRAGDQAMLFKRIVKGCAIKHGMEATFMAKPFGEDLGSGLHVHVSLLDENGNNIFEQSPPASTPGDQLRYATGGLLDSMAELQAIFAPNLNSYRRLQSGSFAPDEINWGYDHRAAAIRLPEINGPAARLEHRICGADANPYLTLTAILGGILHGLENRIEPGEPLTSEKYQATNHLTKDWAATVEQFKHSHLAKSIFGEAFHHVYVNLREHEIGEMAKKVSDVEFAVYLHGA